jgi:coenzyme F420-reducing hydrogenase gamma subunit
MSKLLIAIAGLTACSGCQLTLLNCEDELPELLGHFELQYFPMVCSPARLAGFYDAALIEGCVSMPHEIELIQELRKRSKLLIALGTCAAWGGVAALRNSDERELLRQLVYGQNAVAEETFNPRSLQSVVQVDAVVTGCPPEKDELLRLLTGLVRGALPVSIDYPVCTECRMRENLCLLTERDALCLGPLTLGGCRARCPSMSVPCEGCRGPVPEANLKETLEIYNQKGFGRQTVLERLHRFCPEWKL